MKNKKKVKRQFVSAKTVRKAIALLETEDGAQAFKKAFNDSVNDPLHLKATSSKIDETSEEQLRWKLKNLLSRASEVESLLLEIESKKPDLSLDERTRIRQARCKHRKGGRYKLGTAIDFALRDHTFIDGSRQVRCTICGKIWTPDGKEWFKALEMLEQTTNTRSSSEMLFPDTINPSAPAKPRGYYSVQEVKDAYRPRNVGDENPIRGNK